MTIEQLIEKLESLKARNPYAEVHFTKEGNGLNDPVDVEIEGVVYDVHSRKVILN